MDFSFTFLGGLASTGNLTGSCTAVEVRCGKHTTTFLVDIGLVQGDIKHFFGNNTKILKNITPSNIDYIVLTHAHIDHVGLLPLLVNKGFRGKVLCSQPTADLLPIMLADSHKIQKELAKRFCLRVAKRPKKQQRQTKKESGLLFTDNDVAKSIDLILKAGFTFETQIKLSNQVSLKFYPSGHILGGAICVFTINDPKSKKIVHIGFSGDLGRQKGMLLKPPKIVKEPIDYWFTESTYGDKIHPERKVEIEELFQLLTEAARDGRKVIIPSFALQRSQELIYLLTSAMHNGAIPKMSIYLDSPMSIKLTAVFAKYWEIGAFRNKRSLDFNPFNEENNYLKFVTEEEDSLKLSDKSGAHIVISGAGMCDAGRVRNHLRANLPRKEAIVCLVGYMSSGSLGRKLKDGLKIIRMNDVEVVVLATIKSFDSFSAHADSAELVSYAQSVVSKTSASQSIFILHGEEAGGTSLKDLLDQEFRGTGVKVLIPKDADMTKVKIR